MRNSRRRTSSARFSWPGACETGPPRQAERAATGPPSRRRTRLEANGLGQALRGVSPRHDVVVVGLAAGDDVGLHVLHLHGAGHHDGDEQGEHGTHCL